MNVNIESEILDIIIKGGWHDGTNEETPDAISDLFLDFVRWKDKTVGSPNKKGNYLYWEDYFTLEELCNYWLIYIYKS